MRRINFQTIYPNVEITFNMCACTAVTNCTAEWLIVFNSCKRIENHLRTTASQKRLNTLSVLQLKMTKVIDFNNLIENVS